MPTHPDGPALGGGHGPAHRPAHVASRPSEREAFSPDGRTVLTGSDDVQPRRQDILNLLGKTARSGTPPTGHPSSPRPSEPKCRDVQPRRQDRPHRQLRIRRCGLGCRHGPAHRTTHDHQGTIHSEAFSPDGKTVVTGSRQTARLWDPSTGRPIGSPWPSRPGVSVVFSPDSKTVLTVSRMGQRGCGTPPPAALGPTLSNIKARCWFCGVLSPDGKTVLTLSSGRSVRLWDVATGRSLGQPIPTQK